MEELIEFITQYGYLVIFLGVFIEQIGIPLPSNFLLITAGALAGSGELDLSLIILVTIVAALLGDTIWYYIGRASGYKILGLLCRISFDPAGCVSNAQSMSYRYGEKSLLVAKFVPGLSTFAQPLAGAAKMSLPRFLLFDAVGSALWALVFVGLGYVFSNRIESVIAWASEFGWWFGAFVILLLAGYFARKIYQRRRLIQDLRLARIEPDELHKLIESDEEVVIIDLRDNHDFDSNPELIPQSTRMPPDDLEQRHGELPRDQDIILFCT